MEPYIYTPAQPLCLRFKGTRTVVRNGIEVNQLTTSEPIILVGLTGSLSISGFKMEPGDWLFLPKGSEINFRSFTTSTWIELHGIKTQEAASPWPIDWLCPFFTTTAAGRHEDQRRAIFPVVNGGVPGFPEFQVKGAVIKGQVAVLGNHYHPDDYDELFLAVNLPVRWRAYDTKASTPWTEIIQEPGQGLIIPAGWAHQATVQPGTILVGLSSQPYREGVDIRVDPKMFE